MQFLKVNNIMSPRQSPGFSKTERPGLFKSDRFDALSENVHKINLVEPKSKNRRITDYSRQSSQVGPNNDISFT